MAAMRGFPETATKASVHLGSLIIFCCFFLAACAEIERCNGRVLLQARLRNTHRHEMYRHGHTHERTHKHTLFPAVQVRERAMGRLANLKTAGNAAVQQQAQQAKEVRNDGVWCCALSVVHLSLGHSKSICSIITSHNRGSQCVHNTVQQVPRYLKMLNPEAAKAEAEKDQSQAGGTTLSVHKLQYHTQQMQLQEAKHKVCVCL